MGTDAPEVTSGKSWSEYYQGGEFVRIFAGGDPDVVAFEPGFAGI
jgi:hypothetical protein